MVSILILIGLLLLPLSAFILIMSSAKNKKHENLYNMTCPKCGVKIELDQIFCSSCGNKLK